MRGLRLASCIVLSALAILPAGCGKPGSGSGGAVVPQTDLGAPVDGDWIVSRMSSETENLNPYTSSDAYAADICGLIFDTLIERDKATLELKPSLAESYEASPDHLTYTFKLRQGVVFSDGQPLTTKDVKFSFDTIKDPKVDAPHLRNYYKDVSECVIVDDSTVRFTCTKPYFLHLLSLGTFQILPQHIYSQGDFNKHPNNRNPIGSGPYKLEKWDTGQQIVLVRNDKYWNDARRPRILKRVLQIITDDNAAFQVLLRQDLDMMGLLPEQWVNRANTAAFSEKFDKHSYYGPFYSYIGWNSRREMFADKRARRAMTMLLNREEIRETIYYGLAKTVSGSAFIEAPEYDKSIEPWPFDPEQAKKLLDEAGWIDSDNDGVRDKNGQPFSFELLITNANPTAEQVATVFQEELKRAGIALNIRPLEWATFLQNVDERKFDAVMLGWRMDVDDDPYQVWHSSQIDEGSNYVGFNNPEADAIIEQARTEFDPAKRVELYHRFHAILHEEQPYTFMFCSKALLALDKRFQNVKIYPLGTEAREWWVPTALQRYR